jgi:large subunit ribosomal protein L26e
MKTHKDVSSSRRKCRKAHFSAPSHSRYKLLSANLSKDLRGKYNVKSLPIRRDDEVTVVRGNYKDSKGRVNTVYRKRWCIYIDKVSETKQNGATIKIPIDPSNVVITKLKLTPDRQTLIDRKAAGRGDKSKGKYTQQDVKA